MAHATLKESRPSKKRLDEATRQAHVSPKKISEIAELEKILESYPVIGLVDITGISGKQMQESKRSLLGKAVVRTSKNTLIRLTLKKSKKKGMVSLSEKIGKGASILASNMNPFQLYRVMQEERTTAPAKPGSTAPKDIVIPEGDTGLPPGPAVGELQKAGIPAKIERGSIQVIKETVLVKKGEKISRDIAAALAKLGIEPFEVGFNVLGICEDGFIYEPGVLHVDERATFEKFARAHHDALSLSMEAGIFNRESMKPMIQKAYIGALALAERANIVTKETVGSILARAYSQGLGLSQTLEEK